jgi:hypothetical protein
MAYSAQQSAATYQLAELNATTSTTQQVNQLTAEQNIATLQANNQALQISTAGSVSAAQIAANLQQVQSNNAAAINMAAIAAQMNEFVAQTNANQNIALADITGRTQLGLGQIAGQVAISQAEYGYLGIASQAQANADIARANASASTHASDNKANSDMLGSAMSMVAEIAPMLLMML